jgi:hypothetical protein
VLYTQRIKLSKLLDDMYGAHGPIHPADVFSASRRSDATECKKSSADNRDCMEGWYVPYHTISFIHSILTCLRTGYDTDGAKDFKNKLVGTKRWIGTAGICLFVLFEGL